MRRKVVCGPPVEDMKYVRFFAHYIENTLHVLVATWGDGGLVSGPYLERLPRGLGIEALKFLSEGRPTVALAREENGYCRSVDRLRPLWVCLAGMPATPRTAMSSAFSKARTSSRRDRRTFGFSDKANFDEGIV